MSKSKSKPGSANKSAADKTAVAQPGDKDLMSVSALVIIETECQQYKGLYIRLISDWADCNTNSKVHPSLIIVLCPPLIIPSGSPCCCNSCCCYCYNATQPPTVDHRFQNIYTVIYDLWHSCRWVMKCPPPCSTLFFTLNISDLADCSTDSMTFYRCCLGQSTRVSVWFLPCFSDLSL